MYSRNPMHCTRVSLNDVLCKEKVELCVMWVDSEADNKAPVWKTKVARNYYAVATCLYKRTDTKIRRRGYLSGLSVQLCTSQ
jgi:hypothetical protein